MLGGAIFLYERISGYAVACYGVRHGLPAAIASCSIDRHATVIQPISRLHPVGIISRLRAAARPERRNPTCTKSLGGENDHLDHHRRPYDRGSYTQALAGYGCADLLIEGGCLRGPVGGTTWFLGIAWAL